jgi:DNA processing protein
MNNYDAQWLYLASIKGLGNISIHNLLNHFESIENIFKQKTFPQELKLSKQIQSAIKTPQFETVKKDMKWLEGENNHILTIDDACFPPLLKQAQSPPALLFITGNPDVLLQPQLAVVGSRNATEIGLRNTHSFCFDLANKGLVITSGMALGVDGKAHQAALDANGQTIAVMGTGLDTVYPARHRELAHHIAEKGALVSEFPIGTPPNAFNFPQRNRIICGLSLGTLVVEAAMKSGTLITARQTMEINRPVMTIPGSIHNPLAKGCHNLIKQGAKLVESADEIFEELTPLAHSLSLEIKEKLSLFDDMTVKSAPQSDINEEHFAVLDKINYEPTPIDEIILKTKLTAQEISSILLILELDDLIHALPGAQYIRI